jgi:hypothetical protein
MADASRQLPDPQICRTKSIGTECMMECLVESPYACPFVTLFGNGFYCHHPDREKFEKPDPPKPVR